MNTPTEPTPLQYTLRSHLRDIAEREQPTEEDMAHLGCMRGEYSEEESE